VTAVTTVLFAVSASEIAVRIIVAAAIAVVTTSISLRLLGLRRGWVRALVAGGVGWALGGMLALSLADWDWGADGLVVHTTVIAIPVTMAVAVALDLVARPGSLSAPEQAGLFVPPRPLRAVRRRIDVFRRYHELISLIRGQGFGPFLTANRKAETADAPPGVRLRRVLQDAGGVYVKLGQIAATRPDLLPPEVCAELAGLQNQAPPEPAEGVRAVLEAELGRPTDDVFAEFDWEPLAAASIGQTHVARLHTGESVVVKIQRPDIERVVERDLAALALVAAMAERRTTIGRGVRATEILSQFARSLRAELDFRREAGAMADMAAVLQGAGGVRIPAVYEQLSTRRVLVQERFDGFTVADSHLLDQSAVDRRALAERLLRSSLDQILVHGFFHADPHPGNIFVFDDGSLGLIDFGAVGRLDPIQRAAAVDMLAALVRRDVGLMRDGIERVAELTGTVPGERLERVIARLMADNLRPSGTVEPKVLQEMVPVLAEFGIRLPGDLVLLSRTLVTLEGTLGVLSPGLSMGPATAELAASTSEPIVDPRQMLRDELLSALPRLRRLPDRIDRILTLTARGDLRVRTVVDEDAGRIVRTLVNRALLAAVGTGILIASTMLLVADDGGPEVSADTGLFEIFGYGGLLAGSVLVLRVVSAVARDGTI
jgi:ubiquinone biosynthesis protein